MLKKTCRNEKISYFMDKKIQHHKDLCFPQINLRINEIPIKFNSFVLVKLNKLILKFCMKEKKPKDKTFLKKENKIGVHHDRSQCYVVITFNICYRIRILITGTE